MNFKQTIFSVILLLSACSHVTNNRDTDTHQQKLKKNVVFDTAIRTAHILVALCDNQYQGIIPVPQAIGNGEDLNRNLYWGCANGIRSYFKASENWKLIRITKLDDIRLERLVFKYKTDNFYLICDAYKGQNIKKCTIDFLNAASGNSIDTIQIGKNIIGINGNAKLITYIGHNGLMDFNVNQSFHNQDGKTRDVVVLACKSKQYFSGFIQQAQARPILWTSNLMCLEAYTIHDLLDSYIKNPNDLNSMNNAAAQAYTKHQKCSLKAFKNLLVSGF